MEKADATLPASRRTSRKVNRGHLPAHLPREEIVIEPQAKVCPCCGGDLHVIGEDRSERLDKIPAKGDRDTPAQVRVPDLREDRR